MLMVLHSKCVIKKQKEKLMAKKFSNDTVWFIVVFYIKINKLNWKNCEHSLGVIKKGILITFKVITAIP